MHLRLQEQLVAASQAELEKSERVRELEEQVASLKEQLAAATAKTASEEHEGEMPVELVDVPADGDHLSPQRKTVKKSSVTAKTKPKTKPAGRGEAQD